MNNKDRGLYPKYKVIKINEAGRAQEEVQDWVFVLNPATDTGARFALHAYAIWARREGYDQLSDDIMEKLGRERPAMTWVNE
jgi:hypothetical protein